MPSGGQDKMKETALQLFGGLARSYDRTVDFATLMQERHWKNWVMGRIPDGRGDLVLDVGCGTLLLEGRFDTRDCNFVGIDLTESMVRAGLSKRLHNVRLLVNGDAESLPFPDGTFDHVVSCYVAKYVDVATYVGELGRVVKRGGTVVLYDFAKPRGPLSPIIQLYMQGGLRAVGLVLGLAKNEAAFTFNNLPSIVNMTVWDSQIVRSMEEEGFETVSAQRLTGGVVFAYCGRKAQFGRKRA